MCDLSRQLCWCVPVCSPLTEIYTPCVFLPGLNVQPDLHQHPPGPSQKCQPGARGARNLRRLGASAKPPERRDGAAFYRSPAHLIRLLPVLARLGSLHAGTEVPVPSLKLKLKWFGFGPGRGCMLASASGRTFWTFGHLSFWAKCRDSQVAVTSVARPSCRKGHVSKMSRMSFRVPRPASAYGRTFWTPVLFGKMARQ